MKILIDGRALQTYSAFRGIGRYTRQLIDIFKNDRTFHFLFFNEKNYRPELERKLFLNSPTRKELEVLHGGAEPEPPSAFQHSNALQEERMVIG